MRLARSLSLRFLNLSLLCSAVSAARRALSLSAPLPTFLLLHWFASSSGVAVDIHVYTRIGVHMFQVKGVTVNLHLLNDVCTADIYEKSTVQLISVGLAQARPNYIFALSTALYLLYYVLHLQQYYT